MDKRTNRLIKKLRGFQKADRSRFLLLTFGNLTKEEFILYEFCIAITDWDYNHVETYGTFKATYKEIAQMLNWKADSTANRHMRNLISKGFIREIGDAMKVKDFEKWELRKTKTAKMQSEVADMQPVDANTQENLAKMQPFIDQASDYPLVSSKGNLGLSQEDIDWINENVKEEIVQG